MAPTVDHHGNGWSPTTAPSYTVLCSQRRKGPPMTEGDETSQLRQAINPFFFLLLSALKMISPSFSSSLPLPLFCLLFIMLGIPVSLTTPDYEREFEKCRDGTFKCGNITAGFPFHGGDREKECGDPDLELRCDGDITTMKILVGRKAKNVSPNHQIQGLDIEMR
ncbi:LEAF RUST 10 DISEASE-RESISTANCE LOCUS RECEPTOR-LIKE PROTEIN KINASE-like 2.4 [Gossypium australe]|uniref:LEAF RUST 10 DISEASE-RESISTANCE LOCUS RECEPTOR-LIKE PROTEIN KINASE-like 2.4 n=1 Tax=Gossypium australe TaxID=47621 RepID=A0A5B6VZR8_9ROSI|nr:LEAF RUST 10 DISEASE-RESISTANCE LOCUS RECEPTOR-LIKE PROTEIN KINASE-like 2.4 [Gossypium australe]